LTILKLGNPGKSGARGCWGSFECKTSM